ncbi:hypothetical protein LTR36_007932 [Oleoguttula mirabilis]|uniref:Uncharacterized protein n=1 Tax=Oleoguttula mirabilis TaxID=1507867 RepID=A0AAV9J8Q7_9PEZI|nr:hypothetical protein LTR36_007932 [Oleoguttula mirabilis]
MSAPPALALPLRQAARHILQHHPRPRCLHTLPRRPQPKPSPTQCLRQQHQHQQRRRAGTFTGNARALFAKHPLQVTLAVGAILAGTAALAYSNYLYRTYILAAFHNYPDAVAKKLRRALYYTNTDLQPQEAIKYYRQALQVAEEIGMDPFSDEIMGVKIQVSKLMEDVRQIAKAIQVLEILRNDSLEWLRRYGDLEHNKVKRTRVLAKCVGIAVKQGELYGSAEIYDRDVAEERLVWAVETVLKERQRRNTLRASQGLSEAQLQEQEGPWMTDSEVGASLEALAQNYEAKDQHYLATPLFLQALALHPTKNCHTVVLMNNLASSLAQQSPRAARAAQAYAVSRNIDERPSGPIVTRETMIQNAQTWAQKALDVAAELQPPERDEECDLGCAVATHNLGEFAEMMGNVGEAQKRYGEAISVARAIGFQEGVDNSSERLRKLKGGD